MNQKGSKFTLNVSLRKEFEGDLYAYLFDEHGELVDSAPVEAGSASLVASEKQVLAGRLFVAPQLPEGEAEEPNLALMERLRAYEPVLRRGLSEDLIDSIIIPGELIDWWDWCFCWVRGRVLKSPGDQAVCGARVHICEVDKIPRWIVTLPELEILKLRDDLLKEIERVIPFPPKPLPDPPIIEELHYPLRFGDGPSGERLPAARMALSGEDTFEELSRKALSPEVRARLTSSSPSIVRQALIEHVDLVIPYLCLWPWWWTFRCDEVRVLETDAAGRFETWLIYPCSGDKPDLYFWVEYQIGGSWETVYNPPIPCYTYWDYACGTEVTLRVSDERVPACDPEPDLPGKQVAVLSIGNNASVSEIQGPGAAASVEGLTTAGQPFGGRLEPHVWFSRKNLIDSGVTHYRWSYRRLSGPDGVTPDVGPWAIMTRQVGRHYVVVDSSTGDLYFPFEVLGPDSSNLFRIKPVDPPSPGIEWTVLDAREDTASAFFVTTNLPHGLTDSPTECEKAEMTAGRYEVKLELFHSTGTLVNWTAEGIDLKVADVPAPFGTGTVTTQNAPSYYRILDSSGDLVGFRMVLRVDNNCCEADIFAITGAGLSVDPNCGFIEYTPGASANISLLAKHPNNFATFNFNTRRGIGYHVPEASTFGKVGDPSTPSTGGAFTLTPPFTYSKSVAVSTLLSSNTPSGMTPCDRAAFAETLYVRAMATDGWSLLDHLDRFDAAAFALDTPCPPCDDVDDGNGPGQGRGRGRGRGGGGGS